MAGNDLELFYFTTSFYSQKALMALEELNIPFKRRLIMLGQGENHSSWYMKINPQGQVPVLRNGTEYISDSKKIIEYMDDRFAGTARLIPSKQNEREIVEYFNEALDSIKIPILTYGGGCHPDLLQNSRVPRFLLRAMKGRVENGYLTAKLKSELAAHPEMAHLFEPKIEANSVLMAAMKSRETVQNAIEHAYSVLKEIEEQLQSYGFSKDSPEESWLVGSRFTAADITLAVTLGRLEWIGYAYLWEKNKLPLLSEYKMRVQRRQSSKKVVEKAFSTSVLLTLAAGIVSPYLPLVGVVGLGVLAYFTAPKLYEYVKK